MKGEDSEEVEIDLGDSSDSEEFDNGEEPQTLWKAPPALEEEENIHTTTLVEISDTKPLINVRDPRGINDCLKVLHSYAVFELDLWTIVVVLTCWISLKKQTNTTTNYGDIEPWSCSTDCTALQWIFGYSSLKMNQVLQEHDILIHIYHQRRFSLSVSRWRLRMWLLSQCRCAVGTGCGSGAMPCLKCQGFGSTG